MQVDPIKPKLKPPRTKRLKLNCDILLSTSTFKFNLRRYTTDAIAATRRKLHTPFNRRASRALKAGADTRPIFQLNVSIFCETGCCHFISDKSGSG